MCFDICICYKKYFQEFDLKINPLEVKIPWKWGITNVLGFILFLLLF